MTKEKYSEWDKIWDRIINLECLLIPRRKYGEHLPELSDTLTGGDNMLPKLD